MSGCQDSHTSTACERSELQLAYFSYDSDGDRLVLRSCCWPDGGPFDAHLASCDEVRFASGLEMGMIRQAAKAGHPIYLADCRADARWIEDSEVRSLYIVPVSNVGPCDVFVVASHEVGGIGRRERALVRALVRHLAGPGQLASRRESRVARLESGLRRIKLEIAQLAVDCDASTETLVQGLGDRLRLISPRERQVMDGLRSGLRVATIARELAISPNTVRNHLKSIYRKLGVRSQVELLERLRGAMPRVGASV